jgi:hypothetical protein
MAMHNKDRRKRMERLLARYYSKPWMDSQGDEIMLNIQKNLSMAGIKTYIYKFKGKQQ